MPEKRWIGGLNKKKHNYFEKLGGGGELKGKERENWSENEKKKAGA